MHPAHNPLSNLIYAASALDVETVMIDGRVVMAERKVLTLDEVRVVADADRAAHRIVSGV